MKVSHVMIAVRNLNESVRYYSEVLGLEIMNRIEEEGLSIVFMKGKGDCSIELVCTRKRELSGLKHIGFVVDDIEQEYESILAKGFKFTKPPIETPTGNKIAYLRDPDGIELELFQHQTYSILRRVIDTMGLRKIS